MVNNQDRTPQLLKCAYFYEMAIFLAPEFCSECLIGLVIAVCSALIVDPAVGLEKKISQLGPVSCYVYICQPQAKAKAKAMPGRLYIHYK